MSTVRDATRRRPTVFFEHVKRAQVLDEPIRECAIKLQPITIFAHAAVADEISRVLHREQILTCRERASVAFAEARLQFEVQRIARFFVPKERIL